MGAPTRHAAEQAARTVRSGALNRPVTQPGVEGTHPLDVAAARVLTYDGHPPCQAQRTRRAAAYLMALGVLVLVVLVAVTR